MHVSSSIDVPLDFVANSLGCKALETVHVVVLNMATLGLLLSFARGLGLSMVRELFFEIAANLMHRLVHLVEEERHG